MAALTLFTFTSGLPASGRAMAAEARTVRIVAFGDSLTAGYGLPASAAFPARLEAALKAKGLDVKVENAGVSGETASQGLARLDWSIGEGTDAVIVELGANDMLRGLNPATTRAALTEIVQRLRARGITVLLAGMKAAPNLGKPYQETFDAIFPELAAAEGVLLYAFFLDGVAGDRSLIQPDGLHPNAEGVRRIVSGILPKAEELVAQVQAKGR
ncbi:UNVERIFIED_ORG: acyl-CoA thioesterase-1 [Xanthobacter viscosus]|uniref:Arylesterase n=1 Tax=Xanthobacter autotrophicus TaxID=280 RepID=A0A6C1KQ72_XANAU|nr:arylesterase [Xanthobacter autotrophicus]